MRDNLLKIINHYGISQQLKQLNEENYEFLESVIDYEYNKYSENNNVFFTHLEEEFADVMVVLEQFKAHYMLDNQRIMEIMEKKIDRTLERIEEDKNEK